LGFGIIPGFGARAEAACESKSSFVQTFFVAGWVGWPEFSLVAAGNGAGC
jgi:hypothetical protein